MKQSKEDREFEQMIREEIESGNPFADGSYASYKARTKKTSLEKKLEETISKNEFINSEPNEKRAQDMRDLFVQTALNLFSQ
jgi:hypothetical protein